MENWIDELDEDTKEYDRQVRAGATQYDNKVGKWWQLNSDKEVDQEKDDDNGDDED